MASPRIRRVDKHPAPYPLNAFPDSFASRVAEEIVALKSTRQVPEIEGNDWERIFAKAIGAEWRPSNVGLDDVVKDGCAWGAKTVKQENPATVSKVRLISGRNAPSYSYDVTDIRSMPPAKVGEMVLEIWNERVGVVRTRFKSVRTVVLLKGDALNQVGVFEVETLRFETAQYRWAWNDRKNLEGYARDTGEHRFTWQPHGAQFTIVEEVPQKRFLLRLLKEPRRLETEEVLKSVGFDKSWYAVGPD